jgi:hypothetical protein
VTDTCHCEERSDEAIHAILQKLDRRALLAMTSSVIANAMKQFMVLIKKTRLPRCARSDGGGLSHCAAVTDICHCEERSDEAIHAILRKLDRHAALAMTSSVIANAVKQSMVLIKKTRLPRFARSDEVVWTATLCSQ